MTMERPKDAFTPDEPGALPLDQVLTQVINDDQEQWEYEYSAAETETFYLTVELSYPEFKERSARVPQHSRGGYYKNWAERDPSHETDKQPAQEPSQAAGDNSDNDDLGAERDDEDDGTPLDPVLLALSKGKDKATTPPPTDTQKQKEAGSPPSQDQSQGESLETEDIQILDLHTPSPLFSYRGRLFQGHWAEVIGTEVILTSTSSSNSATLPSLRTLPGDVSLLAASSSRIMTTEKVPRPKIPSVDTLAPIKEEWNIKIPPGKDKNGERAEQINFLENLMALKIKRGDEDQVTVYATDGQGKDWDDRKSVDYRPRRKRIGEEHDVEDLKKKVGRRPRGRPKGRPSLATRLEGYPVGFGEGATRHVELSTMTPMSWEDLDREDADEERSEEDEGGDEDEDEDQDEDIVMTA